MRKPLLDCLLFLLFPLILFSQVSDREIFLLKKLDSTRKTPVIASHFASLYLQTTISAVNFFEHDNDGVKKYIQRLETSFASFFFRAAEAYRLNTEIPKPWKAYFEDTTLSRVQYQLLGINAHINGDIWQALTTEFTLQEMLENERAYFVFNKGLTKEYRRFYEIAIGTDPKTHLLNNISLGLSRLYGKMMMVRWRKRQVQLAILYFSDPTRFENMLKKVQRKMEHINNMILHTL